MKVLELLSEADKPTKTDTPNKFAGLRRAFGSTEIGSTSSKNLPAVVKRDAPKSANLPAVRGNDDDTASAVGKAIDDKVAETFDKVINKLAKAETSRRGFLRAASILSRADDFLKGGTVLGNIQKAVTVAEKVFGGLTLRQIFEDVSLQINYRGDYLRSDYAEMHKDFCTFSYEVRGSSEHESLAADIRLTGDFIHVKVHSSIDGISPQETKIPVKGQFTSDEANEENEKYYHETIGAKIIYFVESCITDGEVW